MGAFSRIQMNFFKEVLTDVSVLHFTFHVEKALPTFKN